MKMKYKFMLVKDEELYFPFSFFKVDLSVSSDFNELDISKNTNIGDKLVVGFLRENQDMQKQKVTLSISDRGLLTEVVGFEKSPKEKKIKGFVLKVLGFAHISDYGFCEPDENNEPIFENFVSIEVLKKNFKKFNSVISNKYIQSAEIELEMYSVRDFLENQKPETQLSSIKEVFDLADSKHIEPEAGFNSSRISTIILNKMAFSNTQNTWKNIQDWVGTLLKETNYTDPNDLLLYSVFTAFSYLKSKLFIFQKEDLFTDFNLNSVKNLISKVREFLSEVTKNDDDLRQEMTSKMAIQQKEYILREKNKIIQEQLNSINATDDEEDNNSNLSEEDKNLIYPESVRKLLKNESKRASELSPASPESSISKTYMNILKKLPWRKTQKEHLNIEFAKETLDKYHYGLDKVKERIIEHIAVIIKNQENKDLTAKKISLDDNNEIDMSLFKDSNDNSFNNVPIICLVGPPGVGKTSLTKAIAEALNKKFVKISLGGVSDESEIRGHRRTYVGAMPGKIVKALLKAEVSNPVILLDEIDKMVSHSLKGDPASSMLEVLDPEQNTKFQDHYLEHEYDLSKIIFIATANYYESIPHALLDRVEVIDLSAYTITEKIKIAKEHLIPKSIQQVGAESGFFTIDDETLRYIIKNYTNEAGVRELKRVLDKIARKYTLKSLLNKKNTKQVYNVEIANLRELLGVERYKDEEKEDFAMPGIVNGLAYTQTGGSTLQIEVNTYPGKSEIKLTGSLKDVMKESAQIAVSYIRSNAKKFGINDFDFDNNIIHIHVPEGATPKDGPSAGVTFTTAIISALTKKPVDSTYGMTGEITLRGKVLEIGGLREKSFAAWQKQIKNVFIPYGNIRNIDDIALEIKKELTYIPVKTYDEIFEVIFNRKEPKNVIKN
ncbi:endopeptidase La [Mycoplasma leonicaptivi]|uniref:endopeptidase La n=1 Tax=Mycoplasma leonicaptivi TaxID=36742 RepID=UPI0005611B1F|nr:endopeptidase La [Mycoplasma leonicaptivi]